jgi:hypothetical protein
VLDMGEFEMAKAAVEDVRAYRAASDESQEG